MIQRPKIGETEEDLLKQQEEFLKVAGKESMHKKNSSENEENVIPKKVEVMCTIVERTPKFSKSHNLPGFDHIGGFPKLFTIDNALGCKKKGKKSLFAMQLEKNKKNKEEDMEVEITNETEKVCNISNDIHEENAQKISKMTEEEILEEQKKLMSTLDPKLISFLKNRNKKKEIVDKKSVEEFVEEVDENEVKKNLEKYMDSKWINMDFIEKEKLEWIGEIPDKSSLEPNQPYSARFDFKGDLQPFSTEVDVRNSLYHHGDEPNRPGYTIQELYQLSRSQVLQQRILALNTVANIIRKTKLGYYDQCFNGQLLHKLVESDLFFLLRFSIDDNPLISASINCLHSLICNESDEFCLDKLLGVLYKDEQPLLFNKIEATNDEEKELKDHVIISCDMIKGIIRTDLLARLSYVLNTFSPTKETVIRACNCLIRISRHSLEAGIKIVETRNLLSFIYSKIKSSEPIFEGVKLFRVLCSLSKELIVKITQMYDFQFLVNFIEAEENMNIPKKDFYLLKLESLYFWKGLLVHDLYMNEFIIWSPCLIRLLLFYTQKIDVTDENDFDFELFSAMTSLIIVCNKKKVQPSPNILVMMQLCLEKWLTQLIQTKKYNFAVSKAIGCAFRYFTSSYKIFGLNISDLEFIKTINSILVSLVQSEVFDQISNSLITHSHLLNLSEVTRDPENLPSLCSVYDGGEEFLKIVQNSSSLPFFISLAKYLKRTLNITHDTKIIIQLLKDHSKIQKYLNKVTSCKVKTFNWFLKYETSFLCTILHLLDVTKDVLKIGFKLLPMLRVDDKNSLKVLQIVCNKIHWGDLEFVNFLGSLYSDLLLETFGGKVYKNNLVPEDWLYKALSILRGKEAVLAVSNILRFISLILATAPTLLDRIPYTCRFYHMCSVFLTDLNVFDSSITNTLEETFNDVIVNREKVNLNIKYEKNKSFYDLYTELITQYAGVSYGLPIFAKFVLFPLQNRFNASFRKLIWFEYLHVLRVIVIQYPITHFVSLEDFLFPCETDESLLVAYINSLSKEVITKKRNPFVYNIAIGNLKKFLDSENQDEKLLNFLKKKIEELQNEQIKCDIKYFSTDC